MITNPQIGATYYTPGMRSSGKKVACKCILCEILKPDQHGQDCIVETSGIRMKSKLINLFDNAKDVLG